ncbi:MAG: hypothetical protein ABIJ42_09705 [Acidobacteriota bacterium]
MRSTYKAAVVVVLVMVFLSTPLAGQSYDKKSWWYGIFGAGAETMGFIEDNYWRYGGGYETLVSGGFGVGIELGLLSFPGYASGVLMISPGGMYTFNRDKKTRPFVTAGYTYFMYDESSSNGGFFGGGINHFLGENWGIRIDVRDHIAHNKWATRNYLEARFGIFF